MSNIRVKNIPRLRLNDLLRRRKMTLKTFMHEFGITTYEALALRCKRLGVQPPSSEEYSKTHVPAVSNPTEGLVVLKADALSQPDLVEPEFEMVGGGLINVVLPGAEQPFSNPPEGTQKKQKKKKESNSTDE